MTAAPTSPPPPDDIAPRLTYLVKQAEMAIRANLDRAVRDLGVTTPQYTALSVLRRSPGISSAQLARRSFVSAQAANEMVAALVRKGLVERRADPSNRRILAVCLTEEGSSLLKRCDAHVDDLEERMLLGLGPAGRHGLRQGLESCVGGLRAAGPPAGTAG